MTNFKTIAVVAAIATVAILGSFSYYSKSQEKPVVSTIRGGQLSATMSLYNEWKKENKIILGAKEDKVRLANFQKTLSFIQAHNANASKTFTVGLNQFSGYSDEEFAALFLGELRQESNLRSTGVTVALNTTDVKDSIDWTTQGAVTGVKNQGKCGSCWSFSATGALEGLRYVKEGVLSNFSEQHLVDCAGKYGNNGCGGGLAMYAFNYVKDNGLSVESDYPYKAVDQTCNVPASASLYKISGFTRVPIYSKAQLKAALNLQPIAVSLEADKSVFRNYKSGVMSDTACGTSLNHAVLAVGYGTVNGVEFLKVKNSWGESWGMSGYILLGFQDGVGICGVNTRPTYPNL